MEEHAIDGGTQETLAIVFGDLVGLDVLTAQLGDLKADQIRKQFFQRTHGLIPQHKGELVKTVGDGLLAVFPQVTNAVEFAIETQKGLQDDPIGLQPGQLTCRFGVHFASVRTERTAQGLDIFGWEVTYAARLLQLQQTTDFLISDAAFQTLPAHLSAQFLRHREAQGSNSPDEPGVWNYRGSLNEKRTSLVRGDQPPKQIGKYEILSVLGEGGMGTVYLARDRSNDLRVALKTLSSTSSKARKRFLEQARGAHIEHQSIVRVYEVGEQDDVPYVAMEFIRGEPLDQILKSGRKLTLIDKLEIVEQVCDGLDYAHSKGVIHRDIKPSNIMLQPNGRIKIIDFTALQPIEDFALTGVMQVVGTIHYISPEQLRDQHWDGRADIWSTGVMLYYVLTGEEPFSGREPLSVMHKILSEPYAPLSSFLNEHPPALDLILQRALAKDSTDRYATAGEMARDLEAVAEELKKSQIAGLLQDAEGLASGGHWDLAREKASQVTGIDPQNAKAREISRRAGSARSPGPPPPLPRQAPPAPPGVIPQKSERRGTLRRLLPSLFRVPSGSSSSTEEAPHSPPQSTPPENPAAVPRPLAGGTFTELFSASNPKAVHPKDALLALRSTLSPEQFQVAPPSSGPPPSSLTQLIRVLDTSEQTVPQAPVAPFPAPQIPVATSPSRPPAASGSIGFTRLLSTFSTPSVSSSFQIDPTAIECAPEAIVVIDIVQATATSDLFGWYAVGRVLIHELREYVRQIGAKYDMCCIKSTGDGFLLTYRNEDSAEVAAIHAVKASHELLSQLAIRNHKSPEQRKIAIRLALHFGEVDILPDDRQGPNISYTFRVEAVSHASLPLAINAIDPAKFPLRDYIICSERVCEIVNRHLPDDWNRTSCGLFKLKGFSGWGELFLISKKADAGVDPPLVL